MLAAIAVVLAIYMTGLLIMVCVGASTRASAQRAMARRGPQSDFKPFDNTPLWQPATVDVQGVYEAERAIWKHTFEHAGWPPEDTQPESGVEVTCADCGIQKMRPEPVRDGWMCDKCFERTRTREFPDWMGWKAVTLDKGVQLESNVTIHCLVQASFPDSDVKVTEHPDHGKIAYVRPRYQNGSGTVTFHAGNGVTFPAGGGGGGAGMVSVVYGCSKCGQPSLMCNCQSEMRACENCKQPTQSHKRYCDACVATQGLYNAENWHEASECSKCKANLETQDLRTEYRHRCSRPAGVLRYEHTWEWVDGMRVSPCPECKKDNKATEYQKSLPCDCVAIRASGGGRSHAADCAMFRTAQ